MTGPSQGYTMNSTHVLGLGRSPTPPVTPNVCVVDHDVCVRESRICLSTAKVGGPRHSRPRKNSSGDVPATVQAMKAGGATLLQVESEPSSPPTCLFRRPNTGPAIATLSCAYTPTHALSTLCVLLNSF